MTNATHLNKNKVTYLDTHALRLRIYADFLFVYGIVIHNSDPKPWEVVWDVHFVDNNQHYKQEWKTDCLLHKIIYIILLSQCI